MTRVLVVGAGIGGLTAAALLARSGLDVTVLEAHVAAGGCAGTFYHQGYRFDAGATLTAGFEPEGAMTRLGETLGIDWPVEAAEAAMVAHLPDGTTITRWTDRARWEGERRMVFGDAAEPFWRWQERTADEMWAATAQGLPFPPQGLADLGALVAVAARMAAAAPRLLPGLAHDAVRPVAARLAGTSEVLRQYVDGQLLISAQVTSARANALYGAAALDMPRRGVAHSRGGTGAIAVTLADGVRRHGGRVLYRRRVTRVRADRGRPVTVQTQKGGDISADVVLFNLPPWDAAALLGEAAPAGLRRQRLPPDGWGAFMLYAGLPSSDVPAGCPLHHQVLLRTPLGEGNSVFLSLGLPDDADRAPPGRRPLTISTHTALQPWWELFETDRAGYEARKAEYAARLIAAADVALPGLRAAADPVLPGTPVTFERFTHRRRGWVGGFPQTSLRRARGPRVGERLWLVGDSVFPGQSVLAVALGGVRVAGAVATALADGPSSGVRWRRA